jgi:hypoxanthine phosphoribosyltransferase
MNKLMLDSDKVKNLTSKICRDIVGSHWRPDYIVGITRGGLSPAVMISHWFDLPCETLKVSLRDEGNSESNLWMASDAFEGKNILIVDDINDTGATVNWIMQDWPSGCFPDDEKWRTVWNNNIRFAVLVDNLASRCDVKMDFSGMEINKAENDVWIDFPWEDWWVK